MKYKKFVILFIIFSVAAFLRLFPNNWDQGQHLHPDERFLTMVGNQMKVPSSISKYLNPIESPFNPSNLGFDFFVYGIFPLTITKLFAIKINMDSYLTFTLLGRILSALCDVLTIFLVFKISELFENKYNLSKKFSVISILLYSSFVLPIQLSHFFTVDMFLNFFVTGSIYFILLFYEKRKVLFLVLSSIFWGFGVSSKLSAIYVLPLILIFIFFSSFVHQSHEKVTRKYLYEMIKSIKTIFFHKAFKLGIYLVIFILSSYITVRFFDPYLFSNNKFYDPRISSDFLQDIATLKSFDNPDAWFPPAVQWITKPPVLFGLYNLTFFGVGVFSFTLVVMGIYLIFKKYRYLEILTLLIWVLLFFIYQSSQFSKTMRYFIFIYPLLAVFAGLGFCYLHHRLNKVFSLSLLLLCILWTAAFYSIYLKPQTRISASHYIYNTIPQGNILLAEHWDDPLPLPVDDPMKREYKIEQLPVFDPESDEKWTKMDQLLKVGDYLILSSNRGWGSILSVPKRYPKTSAYYKRLLENKDPKFRLIRVFRSYPSLGYLGIPLSIPDDFADESFTVYDHPKVMIFQKRE